MVLYELVDADTGFLWNVNVTEAEAEVFNLYHHHRTRAINALKNANVPPTEKWDVSVVMNEPAPACNASKPEAQEKKGKTKWPAGVTTEYLNSCLPYRKWLRLKVVPLVVWNDLSKEMSKKNFTYNADECREKIRNLKRSFRESKTGKHGGSNWTHYWLMSYIYDEDIVPGELSLITDNNTCTANNADELDMASSSNVQSPSVSPMLSSTVLSSPQAKELPMPIESPILIEVGAVPVNDNVLNSNSMQSAGEDIVLAEVLNNISNRVVFNSSEPRMDLPNMFPNNMDIPSMDLRVVCGSSKSAVSEPFEENKGAQTPKKVAGVTTMLSPRNTPSKKKCKGESVTYNAHRNSPRATPKRKTPKIALQMTPEDTGALVGQFLARKDDLLKDKINIKVWKDISVVLGGNFDWELCRAKFIQMDESFRNTFLPLEGRMGDTEWPYFKAFCSIYEIPPNYCSVVNEASLSDDVEDDAENEGQKKRKKLWDDETTTKQLLSLYKPLKENFDSSKSHMRHNYNYAKISAGFLEAGIIRSAKQCRSKMDDLKKKFREEFDAGKKTGASPSTWPHYKAMLEIFHGSASLIPPYSVSAGKKLLFSEDGEVQDSSKSHTGSRSRPSLKTKPKKSPKPKKAVFKSWSQEVHEKNYQQRGDLIKQVEVMNGHFEEGNSDRKLFYAAVLKKLG